ncbi:MAG TPA: DUF1540 domain-containing protein [Desulfotomaculum sp.]|nr:MAG: hypothetical protein VR67_00035 [Peptococcaceae bacterium BRH_c8a]KJS78349.1 MAG: hypothetical protein JL56_01530 [Desulfotomaculum sp. BICA1-6]HBX22803.1 DUF1540 domain-containing protein [Desulfotomaculum sp.]
MLGARCCKFNLLQICDLQQIKLATPGTKANHQANSQQTTTCNTWHQHGKDRPKGGVHIAD